MLVDSDLGRVLYDNDLYRSQAKVERADRNSRMILAALIVGFSILFVIGDFALSQSENINLPIRIALDGLLIMVLIFIIVTHVRHHSVHRKQRLVITERGIMIDDRKWFYTFDMIEKAVYRRGSLCLLLKKTEVWPQLQIPIDVLYIWSFQRFKRELSKFCLIEGI